MAKEDVTNHKFYEGEERFISVAEAAKQMGYSRIHVVRLINAGKIQAKKVGRSFVVDKNSIGGVYAQITPGQKQQIDRAVSKIMSEYGEALKKLGKE